ncbi:MAG: hypothetical protein KDC53_12095, partial [Saprospiraceae bacterium]|nr:hypothetical protein [Saprospiraceae bacterium]
TTCYYLLEKETNVDTAKKAILNLLNYLQIVNVTKEILVQAVRSDFGEFEDGVQYFSAVTIDNITAFITRNKRDFKTALIPILSGEEL